MPNPSLLDRLYAARVDEAWAEGVLTRWLGLVGRARPAGFSSASGVLIFTDKPEAVALAAVEDQTRQVVQRVMGRQVLLLPAVGNSYELTSGERFVRYALGRLKTSAETRAGLGPTAPTMAADGLHALIWDAASSLWDSGHHAQAVQRAATMLSAHVQDKTGRHDVSDATLMTEVFSDKDPQAGKPRLRWPGEDTDLTVKSMRSGLRLLAPGVFLTIRNPATHEMDEPPRQDALERLAALSLLAHWVDGCAVVSA